MEATVNGSTVSMEARGLMGAAGPRTNVGLWLRAILLGDHELYNRLWHRLNGGRKGWNDDEPAVVEAACELAVGWLFGAARTDSAITNFGVTALVTDMRTKMATRRVPPAARDMAAVIRAALGERGTELTGIDPVDLFNIRAAVTVAASDRLALTDAAVTELVSGAEAVAVARGWNPPRETVSRGTRPP
jgi:hypothetical protein